MPPDMSHFTILQLISASAEFFRRHQRRRFFLCRVFSAIGDGGTDISTNEQEMIGARLFWQGLPKTEFVKAANLDLSKSKDGESPDAQCLEAAYDIAFEEIFSGSTGMHRSAYSVGVQRLCGARDAELDKYRESFKIQPQNWIYRLVATSLDGASVNIGHLNGLTAKWQLRAPWVVVVHAVAHVIEILEA